MDQQPSIRWLRIGVAILGVGVVMFAASIATGVAHLSKWVSGTFLVLMVVCALVGFALTLIGASKSRAENRRLVAQAQARAERGAKRG